MTSLFAFQYFIKSGYAFRLTVFVFFIAFIGCNDSTTTPPNVAFYHWKSRFEPTVFEKKWLDSLHCSKIYTRLFDVDWDEASAMPQPVSICQFDTAEAFSIVPTVFMTNKVFIKIIDSQIDTLAELIFNKIHSITEGVNFNEIQIDCDWTVSTRDRYFSFLKQLKKRFLKNKNLSVTLRLHQVRDRTQTGVPPADRAALMCYNMGSLSDYTAQNSIFDPAQLRGYLVAVGNYPLALDVALPLFRWGVIWRDGEVVRLINNLSQQDLSRDVFQQKDNNRFILLKNSYLKGAYLYENDEIRLEAVSVADLTSTAAFLKKHLIKASRTLIFYHLDSTVLANYTRHDLEAIRQGFH